jgi:SAM-dependent methyltransferase
MGAIDQDQVRDFYERVEEIWPDDDRWHRHSHRQIRAFLRKMSFAPDAYILNAGSGDNDYGIQGNMHHMDLAENKISHFEHHTVGSIEATPFPNETFTDIVCVGSVLNYCDARRTVAELSRILRPNGRLILEFESSGGYGYRRNHAYRHSAAVVTVAYRNTSHSQWLYAPDYVAGLLRAAGFQEPGWFGYHYFSGICLWLGTSENTAAKWARLDALARLFPRIREHAHNFILTCRKT